MCQQEAAVGAPEMAWILGTKRQNMEQIIEEEQAHRTQVAALLQMQLQAMGRVDVQAKELGRLSALLVMHQALLKSSTEKPHQEATQAPPENLSWHRLEAFEYLPGTVSINCEATSKTGQLHGLSWPTTVRRDMFEDILTDVEVSVTLQRQVQSPTC